MSHGLEFKRHENGVLFVEDYRSGHRTRVQAAEESTPYQSDPHEIPIVGDWPRSAAVSVGTDRLTVSHSSPVFVRPRETPTELAATPDFGDRVPIESDGAMIEFVTPVRLFIDVPDTGEIRREPTGVVVDLETASRPRLRAVARREDSPGVVIPSPTRRTRSDTR